MQHKLLKLFQHFFHAFYTNANLSFANIVPNCCKMSFKSLTWTSAGHLDEDKTEIKHVWKWCEELCRILRKKSFREMYCVI
jgi:hypothetical protein